jgi:la-related protein 1
MILERRADFAGARARFAAAVSACPSNLRWKIWMAGARLELHSGSEDRVRIARLLLSQATLEAPAKMKAALMIDCARAEEFTGNVDTARDILQRAQREAKTEWKVFLESVLLEMRAQRHDAAILQARQVCFASTH